MPRVGIIVTHMPSRWKLDLGPLGCLTQERGDVLELLAQPIVLSLEAIMLALRQVALALGAFRALSQVFDLTSGPIVQGWVT